MSDLRDQLIKLGSSEPDLRPEIRQIVSKMDKQTDRRGRYSYEGTAEVVSEEDSMTVYWPHRTQREEGHIGIDKGIRDIEAYEGKPVSAQAEVDTPVKAGKEMADVFYLEDKEVIEIDTEDCILKIKNVDRREVWKLKDSIVVAFMIEVDCETA